MQWMRKSTRRQGAAAAKEYNRLKGECEQLGSIHCMGDGGGGYWEPEGLTRAPRSSWSSFTLICSHALTHHIYIYFFAHVMLFLSYFIFEVCFRYVQMSYNMVWICNRLVRLKLLCKGSSDAPEVKINTLSSHFIRYTWTCPPHPVYER